MGISTLPVIKSTTKVWTSYSNPNFGSLSGARSTQVIGYAYTKVYYVGGYYIFGTSTGVIGYSTDAKTWNYQVIFPTNAAIRAIAFNGTTWVVAGVNNYCYSGTPGGSWTARTSQLVGTSTVFDVIWVVGSINLFILIGDAGAVNSLSTSPDGITWTARLTPTNSIRSIAVNTAQTVIVAGNQLSTANQQAYYSTNGTTWNFAPVYNSATDAGYIWYMPHVDKFATLAGQQARRSSASVSTQWDTAPYEIQGPPSYAVSSLPSGSDTQRMLPIWDSVNSKYYGIDINSNGGQSNQILYTYTGADIFNRFSTGSYNRYAFSLEKVENVPGWSATAPSTGPSVTTQNALGYGNGIWVLVNGTGTNPADTSLTIAVWSTAV